MIEKINCILCESKKLKTFYIFHKFPIYMGSTIQDTNLDEFEDMHWAECEECGLIQLKNLIPLEKLYQKAHNPAIGKTWEKHHKNFSNFVLENTKQTDLENVLELGGGNLKLYKNLSFHVKNYLVLDKHSYEPTIENENLTFIQELFDLNSIKIKPTLVIHSHTFEHFYEPVKTFSDINEQLQDNGLMIASIPNISNVINDGYGNGINFEHGFVITETTIKNFLDSTGFELVKIIDYNPYNFFIIAKKTAHKNEILSYDNQKPYFNNFILKTVALADKIHLNVKQKEKTFIFGCHIFSQYVFNINPKIENSIFGILDNDKEKIGKRLYGHNLKTFSPEILKNIENPKVILSAGVYTSEIKEQLCNINQTVTFIEN